MFKVFYLVNNISHEQDFKNYHDALKFAVHHTDSSIWGKLPESPQCKFDLKKMFPIGINYGCQKCLNETIKDFGK